ncbi:MAG: hypothetical protein CL678_12050 [Bdellovibrionaceae bacterium]|nr:hypothetical protein [Pseudobdellovibrionaceae bacterium]
MKERLTAIRAFGIVLRERVSIEEAIRKSGSAETPWIRDIIASALRFSSRIDWIVSKEVEKKKPTGWLGRAIKLGVAQLLSQSQTPSELIVSETVGAIKKKEGKASAGFANALLRKISQKRENFQQVIENLSDFELFQWMSIQPWMAERLKKSYGKQWLLEFSEACLQRPKTWARVLGKETEGLPKGAIEFVGKKVSKDPLYLDGKIFIQDISSQILIEEVSTMVEPFGKKALDLCASPGGKSLGLAWNGFEVIATDYNEKRISRLVDNSNRAGQGRVSVLPYLETQKLGDFDLVWIDAPCTGSGIIRRHPEVKWNRTEEEFFELIKIQNQLIDQAWQQVKPSGFLMYSVCSVLTEEGLEHFQSELWKKREVKTWTLAPHIFPFGDGFYGALFQKKNP